MSISFGMEPMRSFGYPAGGGYPGYGGPQAQGFPGWGFPPSMPPFPPFPPYPPYPPFPPFPPFPQPGGIATDNVRFSMFGFDTNQDGAIDAEEAFSASTRLSASSNFAARNLGELYGELGNALESGNSRVDRDGDGKLSYLPQTPPWPQFGGGFGGGFGGFWPGPADELTRLAGNDFNPSSVSRQDFGQGFPYPQPWYNGQGGFRGFAAPPPPMPGINIDNLEIPAPPPQPVSQLPAAVPPPEEKVLEELLNIVAKLAEDSSGANTAAT